MQRCISIKMFVIARDWWFKFVWLLDILPRIHFWILNKPSQWNNSWLKSLCSKNYSCVLLFCCKVSTCVCTEMIKFGFICCEFAPNLLEYSVNLINVVEHLKLKNLSFSNPFVNTCKRFIQVGGEAVYIWTWGFCCSGVLHTSSDLHLCKVGLHLRYFYFTKACIHV